MTSYQRTPPDPPALPETHVRAYQTFLRSTQETFGFSVSPHSYLRLCLDAANAPVRAIQRSGRRVKVRMQVRHVEAYCIYDVPAGLLLRVFKVEPHPDTLRRRTGRQMTYGRGPYKRHAKHRGEL